MEPWLITLIALVVIGLFVMMYGVGIYNKLVTLKNRFENAFSQIEVQLKRRYDLIPNLVEVVRAYAAHERETLEAVTSARARVGSIQATPELINNPQAFAAFQQSQAQMSSALSRLMLIVENYPDLKANENFRDLQAQLEGTENRIAVARRRFIQPKPARAIPSSDQTANVAGSGTATCRIWPSGVSRMR